MGRSNTKGTRAWREDIEIRDVVCDDNHRQGISVITAKNLLVENSRFQGTQGTLPEPGIDFEPNERDECLTNCVVRNCSFTGNKVRGMLFVLDNLGEAPVSIRLENRTSDRNRREPLFIKARHAKTGSSSWAANSWALPA